MTKKLFGTSSESGKNLGIPGQLSLFDEAEQEALAPEDPEEFDVDPAASRKRKTKRTNADLFRGIPQENRLIPLSEDQKYCEDCGTKLEVIGKEFVRHEFQFTPSKGRVINYYRETAKCPVCSSDPEQEKNLRFTKSEVPEALIPHSYASPSAVA